MRRLIASQLHEISPVDGVVFIAVPLLLFSTARPVQ